MRKWVGEGTYRGPDINAIPDAVDINMIVMAGAVEVGRPVDAHGVLAAAIQATIHAAKRLHVPRAVEIAMHCHRGGRRSGAVQWSHDRDAARDGRHGRHVADALTPSRGLVKHVPVRAASRDTVVNHGIHGELLGALEAGGRRRKPARRQDARGLGAVQGTDALQDASLVAKRATQRVEQWVVAFKRPKACGGAVQLAQRQDELDTLY